MKIIVRYDACASSELHHKLAITLPAKWMDQSVDKVKDLFVGAYNKKFPSAPLEADALVLQVRDASPFTVADTKLLKSADTPAKVFEEKGEVRLVPKPAAAAGGGGGAAAPGLPPGMLRCKNYGCQKVYDPSANCDGACRHHKAGPIFHDTRKWWSCCEEKKVYSFDELFEIPGCTAGLHSDAPPAEELRKQEALAAATAAALDIHSSAAKPGADGRAPPPKQNVEAQSAAPPAARPKRPPLPPGRARCKHFGCQVEYSIADNGPTSCRYHASAPVFHEGAKKWVCCGVKKYDFDEFLAVPGCVTGPHEPEDDE